MRTSRAQRVAVERIRTAVEALEPRQLMSSYFIDTDAAYAALGSKNLAAGDVVMLKGGATFHGRLTLNAADTGSSANPILITSYDPATMKAIASDAPAALRATIAAGSGDGVFAYNTAGVHISGLNIVGSGAQSNSGAGIDFYTDLSGNVKLDGVSIDHVDVSGFGSNGVELGSNVGKSGYKNVKLTDVNAHDNGNAGITTYGLFDAKSSAYANANVYIGYCSVYNNAGVVGSTSPTGSGIVLGDIDGAVIEFSTAYNNGANNKNANGPVGIWVYDCNAVTIQYNESYSNKTSGGDGSGFDLDGGVTNSVMQYNYAHDNAGVGFGMYQYDGARAWNNNAVRYNVSAHNSQKDNSGTEISLWTNDTPMTNAQVYGNTLVVNSSSKNPIFITQSSINASIHDNVTQVGGVVDTSGVGVTALTALPPTTVTTTDPTPVVPPVELPATPVVETPAPVVTTPDPVTPAPADTGTTPVVTTPVVTTPIKVKVVSTRHRKHARHRR